jgi:hypothetical protein
MPIFTYEVVFMPCHFYLCVLEINLDYGIWFFTLIKVTVICFFFDMFDLGVINILLYDLLYVFNLH